MRRDLSRPTGAVLCLGLIIASAAGCRTASKIPGMSWLDRSGSAEERALASAATPTLPPPSSSAVPTGIASATSTSTSPTQVASAPTGAYPNTGMGAAVPASYDQSGATNNYATAEGTQPSSGQNFYNPVYPGSQAESAQPAGTVNGSQYASGAYGGDGYRTTDSSAAGGYGSGDSTSTGVVPGSGGAYGGATTPLSPSGASGSTYSPAGGGYSQPPSAYNAPPTTGYTAPAVSGGSAYTGSPTSTGTNYAPSGSSPGYTAPPASSSNWNGYQGSSTTPPSGDAASYAGGSTEQASAPRTSDPFMPGSVKPYEGTTSSGSASPSRSSDGSQTIRASYEQPLPSSAYGSFTTG